MRLRDQAPCPFNPGMWAQPAKDGTESLVPRGSAILTLQMVCEAVRSRRERPMSCFWSAEVYRIYREPL
jgi:hypothetical protein